MNAQVNAKAKVENLFPEGKAVHQHAHQIAYNTPADHLRISNRLQTTLDPAEVILFFGEELLEFVDHDCVSFLSADALISVDQGIKSRAKLRYNLALRGKKLGVLTVSRNKKFSESEIETVEELVSLVLYPLGNALKYREAIQSAFRDPLTGLNNRAMLQETLDRESQLAERHHEDFSMIMIDVDNFKTVNDEYGHQAGDAVLCQIADIMRHFGRSTDQLFRFAGDEFVITLTKTSRTGAVQLANRIRAAVERKAFAYKGKKLPASISMGVASLKAGETTDELFARADGALYIAKNKGRNCVCCETAVLK